MLNIANPANPPAKPCRADPLVNPPLRTPPVEEAAPEPGSGVELGLTLGCGFLSSPSSLVMFLSRNDMSSTPRRTRRSAPRPGLELASGMFLLSLSLCVVAVAMDLAQAMTAGQLRECAKPTDRSDKRSSWRGNAGAGKNWGSRRATNSCSCDRGEMGGVGWSEGENEG